MWQLIRDGGPIMWLLAVAGGMAGIIFIERFFHFHRAQIRVDDFLKGIYNIIKRGNIVEAASICEETPGPVAQIVRMAVLHNSEGREDMQKAITEAALAEIPRLERNMNLLATVAKITPLLGMLGTVLGMLDLLQLLHQNLPLVHSTDLFRG